jgi:DNA-binding SARP family transcriptional activator/streptogramin lyase
VEFRILGALEASERGREVPLRGPKQRALLVLLLLHRGDVVSRDRLIDELWGEHPPATAAKTLHVHVSHLRKALGDGVLVTRPSGYRLEVSPGGLDADSFENLVAYGREALARGDAHGATELLRAALALWRGQPLEDVAYEPWAQTEIRRLEELLITATDELVEAELALGRHAELVPRLTALAVEHPEREHVQRQLMLALHRSGRQADALAAYRQARRALADELGLEPSPQLRELEAAILAHDPEIEAPPAYARAARPGSPLRLVVLGAAIVVAAAVAAAIVERTGDERRVSGAAQNAVAAVEPGSGRVVANVLLPASATGMAAGHGSAWVTSFDGSTVARIDPARRLVSQTIRVGAGPREVTCGYGSVWVVNQRAGTVSKIDPRMARVEQTIPVGRGASMVAAGSGGVWVALPARRILLRIDPRTGRVERRVHVAAHAAGIATGAGGLWMADRRTDAVLRLDPRTARVRQSVPLVGEPTGILASGRYVWVAGSPGGTLSRITPRTAAVRTIRVGAGPGRLAAGEGGIWVTDLRRGTLASVIPSSMRVATRMPVGDRPRAIAIAGRTVFVAV